MQKLFPIIFFVIIAFLPIAQATSKNKQTKKQETSTTHPGASAKLAELIKNKSPHESLNLTGYDLRKFKKISGEDLKIGIDFTKANLSRVNFSGMRIENVVFKGTNLEEADFSGATLVNVIFEETNLKNAKFNGATITSVSFKKAHAQNCSFDNFKGNFVEFNNVNFNGSSFDGIKIDQVKFFRCILDNVKLTNSSLTKVVFENSRSVENFKRTNLKTSSVSGLGWY